MHVPLNNLLDSRPVLSNSYPNACVPCREAVCTIFMMLLVWPGRSANPRLTALKAATLITKPTRRGTLLCQCYVNANVISPLIPQTLWKPVSSLTWVLKTTLFLPNIYQLLWYFSIGNPTVFISLSFRLIWREWCFSVRDSHVSLSEIDVEETEAGYYIDMKIFPYFQFRT